MSNYQLIITLLSLTTLIIALSLKSFRPLLESILKYKLEFLIIIVLLIGVFYLGGERTEATGLVDTTRLIRMIVYILLCGFCLLKLASFANTFDYLKTGMKAMLLYVAFAMASSFYSVEPLLTLWKAFEVLTHISVAGIIAIKIRSLEDANQLYNLFIVAFTFILVTLLWGAVLYPDMAFRAFLDNTGEVASEGVFGSGLRGTYPKLHLNSVTQIGAIVSYMAAAVLVATDNHKNNIAIFGLLAAGIIATALGHSRTSIFALVASFFIASIYIKNKKLRITVITLSIAAAIVSVASGIIQNYILRGQTEQQFSSLTGRLNFWEAVINAISQSPLIGHGYYAGTRILFGLPGVDNTYLNVLMGGGIVLLIIFLVPIIKIIVDLYTSRPVTSNRSSNEQYVLLWTQTSGLFVILFLRSLSGPSFDANHFNLILFLICSINASVLYKYRNSQTTTEDTIVEKTTIKDNILVRRKPRGVL